MHSISTVPVGQLQFPQIPDPIQYPSISSFPPFVSFCKLIILSQPILYVQFMINHNSQQVKAGTKVPWEYKQGLQMAVISQSDHLIRVDFLYSMLAAKCQKKTCYFLLLLKYWLISLNLMISNCFLFITQCRILFILPEQYSILCMYHIFFIYIPSDGHME